MWCTCQYTDIVPNVTRAERRALDAKSTWRSREGDKTTSWVELEVP